LHCIVYATGEFGNSTTYREFTKEFEKTIDQVNDNRIRAVLYGHEHQASLFLRNGVFYAVAASGGKSQNVKYFKELHGNVNGVYGG
jgi:hypothetical protein